MTASELVHRIGEVFADRYRLTNTLGTGAFGEVWQASDASGRLVAIKFIHQGLSEDARRRFEREAAALSRVDHPNCLRVIDYGVHEEQVYLVTEYIDGVRIDRWAADRPSDAIIGVVSQLLDALEHVHQRDIVHRDLKPSNILVDASGQAKVLDFGVASVSGAHRGDITKTGDFLGTPGYVSPEQLLSAPVIGPAADLYAVGVIMWELLAREPMHRQSSALGASLRNLRDGPPPLPGDHPDHIRALIGDLLQVDPAKRAASAAAALDRLAGPVERLPPTRVFVQPSTTDRRPQQRFYFVLGVVLCLAIGLVLIIVARPSNPVPAPALRRPTVPTAPARPSAPVVRPVETTDLAHDAPARPSLQALGQGTAGCGHADKIGFAEIIHYVDQGALRARVGFETYTPQAYDNEKPHPLVVLLHDVGEKPRLFMEYSGFVRLADSEALLLAAPIDADNLTTVWADDTDADKVAQTIAYMKDNFCIDERRVFVVGQAEGGRMAEDAICSIPGLSAVASTHSRRARDEMAKICTPSNAVPLITFAGLDDRYSPIIGGQGCAGTKKISLAQKEHRWREINGCGNKQYEWLRDGDSVCTTWDCGVEYVSCRVDGGRRWPGAPQRLIDIYACDGRPAPIDMAQLIWNFFLESTQPDSGFEQ